MSKYLQQNRIIDRSEAQVCPEDRGYYFGDGVYEVFRIYGGRLFEKEAHLARLERSTNSLRIKLPYSLERIEALVEDLNNQENVGDGTLYIQITRGCAPRTHTFPPEDTESVLTGYINQAPRPVDKMERGIRLVTVPDIRWLRCDLKTLNLLPNVLAKQEAAEQGADEAVLHRDGTVTECSASNVMIVRDGTVYTHPANNLILHGITRAVVLKLAGKLDIPVKEEAFTVEDMLTADEVFITGTTVEVMPVREIDGNIIAGGQPGSVTRRLQQAFEMQIGL